MLSTVLKLKTFKTNIYMPILSHYVYTTFWNVNANGAPWPIVYRLRTTPILIKTSLPPIILIKYTGSETSMARNKTSIQKAQVSLWHPQLVLPVYTFINLSQETHTNLTLVALIRSSRLGQNTLKKTVILCQSTLTRLPRLMKHCVGVHCISKGECQFKTPRSNSFNN